MRLFWTRAVNLRYIEIDTNSLFLGRSKQSSLSTITKIATQQLKTERTPSGIDYAWGLDADIGLLRYESCTPE